MELFCIRYQDAITRCLTAGIQIDSVVQAMQFITILDPHFDHWTANKRDQMRRHPTVAPSLDSLISEAKDEWRRKQERETVNIQLNVAHTAVSSNHNTPSTHTSVRKEICSYCRLPRHREDMCYYKHVHLRRPGWQPNTITLQKIQERLKPTNQVQVGPSVPTIDPATLNVFDFVQFAHQAHDAQPDLLHRATWITDSGANHHFCNDQSSFSSYVADPISINTGAGLSISPGYGDIDLQLLRSDKTFRSIRLHQVRYISIPSCLQNI